MSPSVESHLMSDVLVALLVLSAQRFRVERDPAGDRAVRADGGLTGHVIVI